MKVFGSTRSRVAREYALICPDSFVPAPLPGWEKTSGVMLVAPALGARFTQYLATMEAGAKAAQAAQGVERVIYVVEGRVQVLAPTSPERPLNQGGFAYVPSGIELQIRCESGAKLNVFEKKYTRLRAGAEPPRLIVGNAKEIIGEPFQGDSDARLQKLLPEDLAFDMAVNIFTYQPGAALPQVEIHVMEHGLLMLEGAGVYRLSDDWFPVQAGDAIWMASYCPQWFVAIGKTPASYLYYKDVNRDPLGSVS